MKSSKSFTSIIFNTYRDSTDIFVITKDYLLRLTIHRALTKSTIASPSSRVEPVKTRSTATTTLCELVSPIDSFTLATIFKKKRKTCNYES